MNRLWMCLAGAAALALPGLAFAGSISPSTYTDTIDVGETISVNKTVTTDLGGSSKVDVFLLADNTGSMGGTINAVATNAAAILNASEFSGLDMGWGVGRYFGDPIEGVGGDGAYDVLQTITTNHTDVTNAIGNWIASGGGDTPEANLYALQQAASEGAAGVNGVSSGEATGWRTGAQRIVAWFGDATGHTETVDLDEAIASLTGAGVTVVGFNNTSSGFGLDGTYGADPRNQASEIVSATGGSLVNNFTSLSSSELVDAIVGAISTAATNLDLVFGTTGNTSGLNIAFVCTDALGCDDVAGGESRTFRMDVTGLTAGTYDFSVFAAGVDAAETDHITVGGAVGVPEPPVLLLFGLGLLGLVAVAEHRRRHPETVD
jgi:hypothetical protein